MDKKSITKPQICVYSKFLSINSQGKIGNFNTHNWPSNNYFLISLYYSIRYAAPIYEIFPLKKDHFQMQKS